MIPTVADWTARPFGAAVGQRSTADRSAMSAYQSQVVMPPNGEASDVLSRLDAFVMRARQAQQSTAAPDVVPSSVGGANVIVAGHGLGARELLKHVPDDLDPRLKRYLQAIVDLYARES